VEVKCIYCGKGAIENVELSESDIILTLMESKIINDLSFIRNHLNIKGKNKKYPGYETKFKIKDKKYVVRNIAERRPFDVIHKR
jgi:hypothetical protein